MKKLDVLANDLFINMLSSSFSTCLLVSEENESVIQVETERQGKASFRPIFGSTRFHSFLSHSTSSHSIPWYGIQLLNLSPTVKISL